MSDDEPHERHPPRRTTRRRPAPAITKDLTALGVLAFVTAAIATVCTCVVALVLPRAARIRAGGGAGRGRLEPGRLLRRHRARAGRSGGGLRHRLDVAAPRSQERRGPGARRPPHPSRGLGVGRVGDPVRGAVVPVPGGARRSQGTLADGDLGPDRFLVGPVPGLRDRCPDLAQPPGRRPRASRERRGRPAVVGHHGGRDGRGPGRLGAGAARDHPRAARADVRQDAPRTSRSRTAPSPGSRPARRPAGPGRSSR